MAKLAKALRAAGFSTWSQTYPSRKHSIGYLASALTDELVEYAAGEPLHAVTHSMGGIVVRHLQDPRLQWSRIVMLAPPNRGSRLAGGLVRNPLFRFFYGPAGLELANAGQWPLPQVAPAIIAGPRSLAISKVTSWTVGRRFPLGVANDGTVAVEETKLAEMADFIEVDATHTWIMNSPVVHHYVIGYLREGRFPRVTG
jgi:hypothetical protein